MVSGDELRTVADFDAEIERLREERARLAWLRDDPEQREVRAKAREQHAGRWVVGVALDPNHIQAIRALAGADAWVWDEEWLKADGWRPDDKGSWRRAGD